MQTITIVLILLLTVTASNFLARMAPFKLPLPLLQIVVGFAVSYATAFDIVLNPDIFFLLFIPPLLFLDGWRVPKGALLRDHRPILMLAIGLVIFTVVCIGLLIDWLIPMIPFAAYLAAEHLHASGILAAATAGITMHYADLLGRPLAATRMQRNAVWDTRCR